MKDFNYSFYLGQEIVVEKVIVRSEEFVKNENNKYTRRKFWKTVQLKQSKSAIVIGVRTLSDGETHYDVEHGFIYSPIKFFKALLVVSNLKSSPFFVKFPEK